MKIGITCYPTYGGSGVVATELGIELAARGHEIHFISYAPPIRLGPTSERHAFSRSRGHQLSALRSSALHADAGRQDARSRAEADLDLLHVHYAIPHSVSALLARSMAAPRRLPFITTLHGTDITLVGSDRSYLPITRFSIEQSDGVTAISHYLRNRTVDEFDIKRPIEVIPNFVNCDLYCRRDNPRLRAQWAPDGEPILMHLSNFRPVKRVTDVVEIFALRPRKDAGQAGADRRRPRPRRRRMAGPQERNLHATSSFSASRTTSTKSSAVADLFLLPSDSESFGLAALEAMACEVPVIATRVGGLPEVVDDGVDGYLVEPRDVGAAARFALEILSRADRGREMGQLARAHAQGKILLQRHHSAVRKFLSPHPRSADLTARRKSSLMWIALRLESARMGIVGVPDFKSAS